MLDRLEAGAARQRAFVADAAHELRSPLAALRTSIEVARAHPQSYDTDELAADLEGEVLRMQALVDDLLLLARVGSTPMAQRRTLDLGAVARDVVPADASPSTVTGLRARAAGDAAAVGRVLRNLVDNAVRHAGRRVAVTVGRRAACGSTTTAPGSTRPTASGCSSGSCGSTRRAAGRGRQRARAGDRPGDRARAGRRRRARAPPTWAGCGRSCGCRGLGPVVVALGGDEPRR